MNGKFITTTLKLAVLAGGKRKKVFNVRRTDEVKETKAMIQAHELLWSKYNRASRQSVITVKYQ